MTLCKYYKDCYCACSGEADEVGEIDELCNIGRLHAKLEKIKEIAENALKANYCNNCDGVGLPECQDTECHTYALDKIMNIIKGAEECYMKNYLN